jgi:hypothetical protein
MRRRKAFLFGCLAGLFTVVSANAQIYDYDDVDEDSRSSRRGLRDRRSSDSAESFDDLRRDFGNLRDRTYYPGERRSITERRSTTRDSTDSRSSDPRSTSSVNPPAPKTPPRTSTSRTSPGQPSAARVIAGQKPPSPQQGAPRELSPSRPVLYLDPPDMFVTQAEPFEVELRLSNPTQELFDSLAVTLAYDPTKLELLDADPSTPEGELSSAWEGLAERYGWLAEQPSLYYERSDPDQGQIEIRFQTPEGKTDVLEGTLGRFRLVPLASGGETSLTFVVEDDETAEIITFIRQDEADILGSPNQPDDGVLDARFRVSPEVAMTEAVEEQGGDYKTRILFDPPLADVALGETFDVDIVLENPVEVPFDTLILVLGYNPRVLRAMDYDQNNWSKDGVNIHDGDSVALFPFTDRITNQVLRQEGVILYRAASPHEPIRAEGVIATIRFTAIGPTDQDGTPIKVGFHQVRQSLNSGLFLRGRDVLAESEVPTDGFSSFYAIVRRHEVSKSRNVWRELERVY